MFWGGDKQIRQDLSKLFWEVTSAKCLEERQIMDLTPAKQKHNVKENRADLNELVQNL